MGSLTVDGVEGRVVGVLVAVGGAGVKGVKVKPNSLCLAYFAPNSLGLAPFAVEVVGGAVVVARVEVVGVLAGRGE